MRARKPIAFALVGALGLAGVAALANAQTQAPPSPPASGDAASTGPGPGWAHGMGPHGWGMGDWGMGWGEGGPRMSREDRAAFFDARIAAVHAGLHLNADQEKLWGPVESALREMQKTMSDLRDKAKEAGRPKDPIDGLQRMANGQIARGQALKKIADAAAPLYASLTPEQKERLPLLAHPGMRGRIGSWMREHGMRWGPGGDGRDQHPGWRRGWGYEPAQGHDD